MTMRSHGTDSHSSSRDFLISKCMSLRHVAIKHFLQCLAHLYYLAVVFYIISQFSLYDASIYLSLGLFLLAQAGTTGVLEEDRRLCKELFRKYLQEVLVASRRYKLELLAACLRLCLSAPPLLVGIASIIPSLRNALKIGLRYPLCDHT